MRRPWAEVTDPGLDPFNSRTGRIASHYVKPRDCILLELVQPVYEDGWRRQASLAHKRLFLNYRFLLYLDRNKFK